LRSAARDEGVGIRPVPAQVEFQLANLIPTQSESRPVVHLHEDRWRITTQSLLKGWGREEGSGKKCERLSGKGFEAL
jgi:hypothetical protein